MKTIYSLLVVMLLVLASCNSLVREVSPDRIPVATAKLVVHSYISPQDTVLTVLVETPSAVIGQQINNNGNRRSLSTATVSLSDGSRTVRLPYSAKDFLYRIASRELPIVAGATYTLTVSAPNFPTATAQCTVPSPVKPTEIRVDSINGRANGLPGTTYFGRLVWRDLAGQRNTYQVSGMMTKIVKRPVFVRPNVPPRDTTLSSQFTLSFNGSRIFTDQNADGGLLISSRGEAIEYSFNSQERTIGLIFTMTLSTIDENSYRYSTAIDQQGNANDNPFAEPVLIPNNIRNGLGCFGALNQSPLTVKVR